MRRLYEAKLGETVDGRLRLYGDWGLHFRGMHGGTETGGPVPLMETFYWFTFKDGDYTYVTSSIVKLKKLDAFDYIVPFQPFTEESDYFKVEIAFTNHDINGASAAKYTTTCETSQKYPG